MQNSLTSRLKELRGNKTQAVFAKELGVIQQTYARWENGQNEPNIEKLKILAHTFGVKVDWLLGLDDTPPPPKTNDPPDKDRTIQMLAETVRSQQHVIETLTAVK